MSEWKWDVVIHGYSMEDAVRDGMMVVPPGPIHVTNGENRVISTITTNLVTKLDQAIQKELTPHVSSEEVMTRTLWATLGVIAHEAERTPDNPDGYMLTREVKWPDGSSFTVWFLHDGRGAYTAMLPEDY